jgi:putative endonuclease
MAAHNDLGKAGERSAVSFLKNKGFDIIATNWRKEKAEADIIATYNGMLVIVEVKTRSTDYFGTPEEAVHTAKQRMMVRAAELYLEETAADMEVRYDVVSVVMSGNSKSVYHIEEAFYPFATELGEQEQ